MYTSNGAASALANSLSLASSSAWKRKFSKSRYAARTGIAHQTTHAVANAVFRQDNFLLEQPAEVGPHRFQTVFWFALTLRAPEVRGECQTRASLERVLDTRQRGLDARIAGDFATFERYVEVEPQ